ncbi:MAG TPA: gamma-glutamylcyclotransferase family protein [Pyrinomonadaceae bacterium]|nr:gamma-glutamylcyclotransferase family protein [Pyrinomonadaceae bacterium]
MSAGKHLVFVYGTLRRGGVRAMPVLFPGSEFVGRASVRGRLYDFGDYPGLLLDGAGTPVAGEVYEVGEEVLKELDDIEAPAYYSRREAEVSLGGGGVTCWVYEPDLSLYPSRTPIPSGDWIEHAEAKAARPEGNQAHE